MSSGLHRRMSCLAIIRRVMSVARLQDKYLLSLTDRQGFVALVHAVCSRS